MPSRLAVALLGVLCPALAVAGSLAAADVLERLLDSDYLTDLGAGFGGSLTRLGGVVVAGWALGGAVAAVAWRRLPAGRERRWWTVALVLAPTAAPPLFAWYHLRGDGLASHVPACRWSRGARAVAGVLAHAGTAWTLAWLAVTIVSAVTLSAPAGAVVGAALIGGALIASAAGVLLGLFVIDALRSPAVKDAHRRIWVAILVAGGPAMLAVYWWLAVRRGRRAARAGDR